MIATAGLGATVTATKPQAPSSAGTIKCQRRSRKRSDERPSAIIAMKGTLITRSSYYLNLLTGGSFQRLSAANTDITINGLSEGTRDQLFLALRLAALEEYLKTNEPQPLILDDTFVHFDDDRARNAFIALAEFSATTQVTYFTHHRACVTAAVAAVSKDILNVHDLYNETVPLKLSA